MDYNNNLIGGKRPHRNITKYKGLSLSERLIKECIALAKYHKRVKQGKYKT